MRNLIIITILFIIGINANAQIQIPKDIGEGEVIIGTFVFPSTDSINTDTTRHAFMQFDYHIGHNMIFRKGNINSSPVDNLTKIKKTNPAIGAKVETYLLARMITPTYLIDWDKKVVFTYHHIQQKDASIIVDSLKTYTPDIFFRAILLTDTTRKIIIDTVNQYKVFAAGIPCYKARYKDSNQKNWHWFTYTKSTFPFLYLLNYVFNYSFPFPVISYDAESSGILPGGRRITYIVQTQIISINNQQQTSNLFRLPINIAIHPRTKIENIIY